jgi:WD40 repeat protein
MRLGTRRHRVQGWQALPDGKAYLSVQRYSVQRIDANSGRVVETWTPPSGLEIVGVSPDGRFMLMTNRFIFYTGELPQGQDLPMQEWKLTLYDLAKRKEIWSTRQMSDFGNWATSGKWIAATGQRGKGTLRLWDAENGKELWKHQSGEQLLSILGFADGEKLVATRGNNDGRVYLFDRATGKEVRSFATAAIREYPAAGALLTPDCAHIIMGGWNPKPRIWDLAGKEQPPLEAHQSWAQRLAFSPDGKKLYSTGNVPYVLERAWPSGKPLRIIGLGRTGVQELAVSGDGKRLEVMFWGEQALAFHDLETEKPIPEAIDGHRGSVYAVACAPDGSLVTFACDATVRTWDLKEGKATAQIKVQRDLNAGSFALSADGRRVAVPKGDIDGILIYERATGKLLKTIPADNRSMKRLTFSPDGRFLAAIDTNRGIAQVWESESGKQVLKVSALRIDGGDIQPGQSHLRLHGP